MQRTATFVLALAAVGCGTTVTVIPRETIPLGGNVLSSSTPGETYRWSFVLDNATNGVHAEGIVESIIVPYQDERIPDAVAEVATSQSTKRTQYGFPIEPKMFVSTTVLGRDSTGFTSLTLARGKDGRMRYVISPTSGEQSSPEGGVVTVGLAMSSDVVLFDDGSTESGNASVTGVEVVDVPCGRFETFVIEYAATSGDSSGTSIESGTKWIHPKVGLVRLEATYRNPDGVSSFVMELEATNIPL